MQASTVGGVRVQLHRPTTRLSCASAAPPCIPPALPPPPALSPLGSTLAPPAAVLVLSSSPLLPSLSVPCSLPPSLSFSLLFVLRPVKSPRFSPLSLPSRVSRPSRPGPRATTESTTSASRGRMLRAAPVNVTLKTEGACTHSPHPAAVAPRGGALYRTCECGGC